MNSRERNYFAAKNMKDFMDKLIKADLEGFPSRSFGESRKLQGRSNTVNKHMEFERRSSTNGQINHSKFCDMGVKVCLSP